MVFLRRASETSKIDLFIQEALLQMKDIKAKKSFKRYIATELFYDLQESMFPDEILNMIRSNEFRWIDIIMKY
ncbi:MAG: hypothetical protein EOP45_18485 [Sphingobacteriaceae bacterium]|nr:MAG: hypothetical protein EOP45_18485 [Sphingobacteriaceae bacterium]